jgi:uncharacterized delta-60 repeat protein
MIRKFLLFCLAINCLILKAQSGQIDTNFNLIEQSHDQLNAPIWKTCIQSDGKILIGGEFKSCNINRILRLNSNGSIDSTFETGEGFDGLVNNILCQPDGKIIVSGYFSTYNGIETDKLVRLNSDGSIDATFSNNFGFNNEVSSICLQPDGKIIVCGSFTTIYGLSRKCIVRLNIDGTLDNSFNTNNNLNDWVYGATIQPDGKIIVSGWFTSYGTTSRNYIARLNQDGSLDLSFNTGVGFDSFVQRTVLQSDGKIIAYGYFNNFNTSSRNYIARLNSNGTLDNSFNVGQGLAAHPSDIKIYNNGLDIMVTGNPGTYNDLPVTGIFRLSVNGTLDENYNNNMFLHFQYGGIWSISESSDGKIIVGGYFSAIENYNDLPNSYITKLNTDGTLDTTFSTLGTNLESKNTYSLSIQSDNKIIVGGNFLKINGVNRKGIARLNPDGSLENTFNPGSGFIGLVYTTAVQPDGKILAGGNFHTYNEIAANYIIRLLPNGDIDPTFVIDTAFNGSIFSIKLQADGKILVGGNFNAYNGVQRNGIARLNPDGSLDNTFNPGTVFSNQFNWMIVRTIAIQNYGKIICGGDFTLFNGNTVNDIVRFNTNGTIDETFNTGSGIGDDYGLQSFYSPFIQSVSIQNNGKIIIVGEFSSVNGVEVNRIAKLNTDGSLDSIFNRNLIFNTYLTSSVIMPDGKIIVAGLFDTLGQKHIARLNKDGYLDLTFESGLGFNSLVNTIVSQPDGKILVGGDFNCYNGSPRDGIVRLENSLYASAIEKELSLSIQLYPNPAKSTLSISGINESFQFEIRDIQGKLLKQGANDKQIDIEGALSGHYYITIITEKEVKTLKFVKY